MRGWENWWGGEGGMHMCCCQELFTRQRMVGEEEGIGKLDSEIDSVFRPKQKLE